jgi:oligopeptidase B
MEVTRMKKPFVSVLLLAIAATLASAQLSIDHLVAPVAKTIARIDTLFGDIRVDNYYWLRHKADPTVVEYINEENSYTAAVMKPTEGLQQKVYDEIISRTKQTDLSAPYRLAGYWYYTRTEEGKQYPIYCRKKGAMDAPEEITVDVNHLSTGHSFAAIGVYQVSDDASLLAYSLDTTGFRQYQLYLKDLRTGALLSDSIGQVNTLEWNADSRSVFYVREDNAKRAYRLYRHDLGTAVKDDPLLYEEKDELFDIGIGRSSDKKLLLLASASKVTSEVRALPADRPRETFRILLPRETGHEYDVDHRGGLYYIRTNRGAKNFRLVTAPDTDPREEQWKEVIPARPAVKLEGMNLFENHAVYVEREDGLIRLRIHDFTSGQERTVPFPEPVYAVFPGTNPEYHTTAFRYLYQSFVTPSAVFEYDMVNGTQILLKQTEVLGGYDPSRYASERVYAKADDGTMVPISLVYRKGLTRDGSHPMLLYGYGSYGASIPVTFSIARLSLLDRGVVYALAHIRGGGDLGEDWRDAGKMMKKKTTFTDFIACAEHLIRRGYTSKDRLAIQGGSAGGLLIGAVLNMRPDLFKAAHCAVPFVDVINSMSDSTLPLTVGEFIEWGNPKIKEQYEYMKTYCPYTNIAPKAYPATLVTTSFNDSQVMYWEPVKYTAKMRTMRTDHNPLLLKVTMGAGHGGASGRYDAFREQAFIFAFLLTNLGVTE